MSIVSYAQNYEDVRLWRAFGDVGQGRYLDIGTQDPIQDSVSLAFYERGWRGVHVEPTAAYAAAMRAARPDEAVIEAAVSTAPGPLRFFEIPQTGLSTGNPQIAESHQHAGREVREILVPTVTLAGVLDIMGPDLIHWMKIDVEGMEEDVLKSWSDHPARPAALVIEATAPGTQRPTHRAWHELVTSKGYVEVLFDGLSRYFVHESHAARGEQLALSPNVFDGYQIHEGHFTAHHLLSKHHAAFAEAERQRSEIEQQAEAKAAALVSSEASAQQACQKLEAAELEISGLNHRIAEEVEAHTRTQERGQAEAAEAAATLDKAKRELAVLEATSAELAHEAATKESALAVATAQLDALRQDNLRQIRENGVLDGRLAAQVELNSIGTAARAELHAERDNLLREIGAVREQARADGLVFEEKLLQLQRHIAYRETQLRDALSLLEKSPEPLANLPRTVAALVRRSKRAAEVAAIANHRTALENWKTNLLLPPAPDMSHGAHIALADPTMAASAAVEHRVAQNMESDGPITSVPKLLAPHDREFIRTAYQAVLGRAPDAEGEAYYLARLRSGTHKLAILKQLRRSTEGRAFIPGVAGLDRAIKRHHLANIPLIGLLFRLATGHEVDNAITRELRIVTNEVARTRSEMDAIVASLVGIQGEMSAIRSNNAHHIGNQADAGWDEGQASTLINQYAGDEASRDQPHKQAGRSRTGLIAELVESYLARK